MSRQDKATTEKNARILRDLVKQPDNKACADCRKNVKSIDLDIWTPEQMETIQKWGNKRANLYWERHLKAGHVPPDHKIESFIRSKYESRRWAMDGPPPADPSELESGAGGSGLAPPVDASTRPTPTTSAAAPAPASAAAASRTHPLLSRTHAPKPSPAPAAAPIVDLFGSDDVPPPVTTAPPSARSPQPPVAAPQPTTGAAPAGPTAAPTSTSGSNIFDLDFKAPTSPTGRPQTAKADIMSLFSHTTSPSNNTAPAQNSFFNDPASSFGSWGGGITSSAAPQQHNPTQTQLPQTGGWGGMQMDQGAWGAPVQSQQAQPQQQNTNAWGGMSTDPWASSNGSTNGGGFGAPAAQPAKKDDKDPFANLWS